MAGTKAVTGKKIAVIGATGNVGRRVVEQLLNKLHIPVEEIDLYASESSEGTRLIIASREFIVHKADECDFNDVRICLLATNKDVSAQFIPQALENNALVIDSSALHRLDKEVPLIVAPVNGEMIDVRKHQLYALANCVASPIAIVLSALHKSFPIKRVSIVTYQSTSGAGKSPMDELKEATAKSLANEPYTPKYFPKQIAFNVIPMIGSLGEDGYTTEEFKIINEIKKIVDADFALTAMSVRVPVMIGHSVSLAIEFAKDFAIKNIEKTLANTKSVSFDAENYPTPIDVVDTDAVHVGRMHRDISVAHGLHLWLCSDNLRRGAATDAVEVVEEILRQLQK